VTTWVLLSLIGCRESLYAKAIPPDKEPAAEYESLLAQVVTDDGLVDYDALEADRRPLDRYVAWLAGDNPLRGRQTGDHHPFWLNAYNALVLYQVLERGRPASVLDVDGFLPVDGAGFFFETQFKVEDEWLSLSDIEGERIRWMELDLRDHAALNCASRSCPPLRAELYRRGELERQLKDQMRRWVNDPVRGVRVDDEGAQFSAIFSWYARDFAFFSAGKSLCDIAATFADKELARRLSELDAEGCPHDFLPYDWRLNDANTPE